ncbi:MAG: hypothetical protein ACLP59_18600 [Bryobacteraceae bacterium]
MHLRRSFLLSIAVPILGLSPLMAAKVVYTITGTLGPVLSGSDPLGGNGESGTLTATVAQSLTPTSKTKTSATYTLPAGAITVVIGGTSYGTVGTSTLEYKFPATGADSIIITATINADGFNGTVVGTAALANGSFPKSALKHPQKFSPSPQALTAAKKASGAGSKVAYSVPILGSTTLGLAGSASN